MNGRLMKMELDGNINNLEKNRELSEKVGEYTKRISKFW